MKKKKIQEIYNEIAEYENKRFKEYQTALEGLGFPTGANVQGQQSLSFDISGFMSLLSMLNKKGNCDFKLTVTDASGTNVKTIQLYVTPKSE